MKQIIRLTESDIHRMVRQAVRQIMNEAIYTQNHIFSEKELQWFYDNQYKLDAFQRRVLNAAMWVRAMRANYHGYARRWFNIVSMNGNLYYYDKDGQMRQVPIA